MSNKKVTELPLNAILLDENYRKVYDTKAIKELAGSIKEVGVLQPLLVQEERSGKHLLIFGLRRFLAAKDAGMKTVPCIIHDIKPEELLSFQLIENGQRENTHPMDDAIAIDKMLKAEKPFTIDQIATVLTKPVGYITKRHQLTQLLPELQKMFLKGEIEYPQAFQLSRLQEADQKKALEKCWVLFPTKRFMNSQEIRQWIEQNLNLKMKDAPFDVSDPELVKAAGACEVCPKRTRVNVNLFDDLSGEDLCMDGKCFKNKVGAYLRQKEAKLLEKNEVVLKGKPTGFYGDSNIMVDGLTVAMVKKSDTAIPVLMMKNGRDGTKKDIGKVVYVPANYKTKAVKKTQGDVDPAEANRKKEEAAADRKCLHFRYHLFNLLFAKVKGKYKLTAELRLFLIQRMFENEVNFYNGGSILEVAFGLNKVKDIDLLKAGFNFNPKKVFEKLEAFTVEQALLLLIIAEEATETDDVTAKTPIGFIAASQGIDLKAEKVTFNKTYKPLGEEVWPEVALTNK